MLCNNLPSGPSPSRCVVPVWGILLPSATCLNELTLAQGLERALPQALPCPCCCHQPGGQAVFAGTNGGGHGCPSSPEPGCAPAGLQEEGGGHSPSPGSGGSCSPWQWGRAAHRVTPSQAVLPASGPSPQLGAQARRAASGWQCPRSTGSHTWVRDFCL